MAAAKLYGPACVIAVDLEGFRLETALKQGLADAVFNPLKHDVKKEIFQLTDGRGADKTIEAVGVKPTYEMAVGYVRDAGVVSIVGVFQEPQELKMNEL
ncbi:MAG: zinc-binding dehydrogenase, partial [Oscillospiraceae bacterium]|nr:zinc-binding dehydrogenase [Oscillospiraceae bacterium]